MYKRIIGLIVILTSAFLLVSCINDSNDTDDITITLNPETASIKVDEIYQINVTTNDEDGVTFESNDEEIATVSETGVVRAVKVGSTTIVITSKTDEEVTKTFTINVKEDEVTDTDFEVSGPVSLLVGTTEEYSVSNFEQDELKFESSNEEVLEVSAEGIVSALSTGTATIKVTSKEDDLKTDEITINVVDKVVLNASVDKVFEYEGQIFSLGSTLFKTLDGVIDKHSVEGLDILAFDGTYTVYKQIGFNFNLTGITDNAVITGNIIGKDLEVNINNINFDDASIKLENSTLIFENNTAKNTEADFIEVDVTSEVKVQNNNFDNITGTVVKISNLENPSRIYLDKNNISNSGNAFSLHTTKRLTASTLITMYRNKINNVDLVFDIDLSNLNNSGAYKAYARFNEIENFTTAAKVNVGSMFEFTLNYWGTSELDYNKFENVDEKMLLANYENKEDILPESQYDSNIPVVILLTNPIEKLELGESYRYEILTIPFTANQIVRYVVSKTGIVSITNTGFVDTISTGELEITARAASNISVNVKIPLIVTTDPGIHLTPNITKQGLQVGDELEIDAVPFPYNYVNKDVQFESSNESIATVDAFGKVTIHSSGLFTIMATLVEDNTIVEEISFESYDEEFDDANIMDFITQRQMLYSEYREIEVYGAGYNYISKHLDAVSRVYLGDIVRTTEHISKNNSTVRPGTLRNSNIDDKFKFNEHNIVWIVIHETANTSPGAGAFSHSNYLKNQANGNASVFVSWNATIDSEELFEHIPYEEVAYHAGDGSRLPTFEGNNPNVNENWETSYPNLGGGNRNGIGIEMAVNEDGNIMRTWHRAAKFSSELMHEYNLPITQLAYHNSFSGKACPQSMLRADLLWLFEEQVKNEYDLIHNYDDVESINLLSHNLEYLDNTGTIIKLPERSMTVSYDIEVTMIDGTVSSKTFQTYLPGTFK